MNNSTWEFSYSDKLRIISHFEHQNISERMEDYKTLGKLTPGYKLMVYKAPDRKDNDNDSSELGTPVPQSRLEHFKMRSRIYYWALKINFKNYMGYKDHNYPYLDISWGSSESRFGQFIQSTGRTMGRLWSGPNGHQTVFAHIKDLNNDVELYLKKTEETIALYKERLLSSNSQIIEENKDLLSFINVSIKNNLKLIQQSLTIAKTNGKGIEALQKSYPGDAESQRQLQAIRQKMDELSSRIDELIEQIESLPSKAELRELDDLMVKSLAGLDKIISDIKAKKANTQQTVVLNS